MNKSIYQLDRTFKCEIMNHDLSALKFVSQDIEALSYIYPDIKKWYWKTFANGFASNEREMVFVRDSKGDLAGFSLLKNSSLERKICTFYLLPEFRESGLGRKFLPFVIDLVGAQKVGITVSDSIKSSLETLLISNGFEIEKEENGLYLPKKKEIFYKLY